MSPSSPPNLLLIETATKTCSVAVYFQGKLTQKTITSEKFVHAELLHRLIDELMKTSGCSTQKLEGVAVDLGPGSYTGLRIGVSAAKGLAYALSIPVVGVHSTEVIAQGILKNHHLNEDDCIVSVVDARRMEVYTQMFDHTFCSISQIEAKIIDEKGFEALDTNGAIYISGDAVQKIEQFLGNDDERLVFDHQERLLAENMVQLAVEKLEKNETENVAYFEPFYLKNFVAGKPKKLV